MGNLSAVRSKPLDERTVGTLFESHRTLLQRMCSHWTRGCRCDADDLLGEAYLKAVEATLRPRAPIADPLAWLSTIIANLARDRLRRHGREMQRRADHRDALESVPDGGSSLDSVVAAKQRLWHALHALPALTPAQRIALIARSNGEGYAAIARNLGTSQVNARKLVQAARDRLRIEDYRDGAGVTRRGTSKRRRYARVLA